MDTRTLSYRPADTSVDLVDQSIGDALREAAAESPDSVALVEGSPKASSRRQLTYAELLERSEQVARALSPRFQPGEHVAVWSGSSLEWVLLQYGAALAGLVLVTVNPAYQTGELAFVLRQSRSAGLFHMSAFRGDPVAGTVAAARAELPDLREVVSFDDWGSFTASADPETRLPPVGPYDDAQIQYTSGTTGFPKGVLLHHRGLVNNGRLSMQRLEAGPADVLVWPMPLFHTAGCVMGVLGALAARATLVCMTQFDPALQLRLIESERATITGGVPTMLRALMAHPDSTVRDLSMLRTVVSGAAPVPVELARQCEDRFGAPFAVVFGTTECSCVVTGTRLDDPPGIRTGTLGTPLPHTEVMVADVTTGRPVETGTVGELCVRGYLLMHGYFDDPEATATAIDSDGWYHTGDLAAMDDAGRLSVEGRIKDMIIRGGENIYPREVEDLLQRHPEVAMAAVVGRPDATWGETPAAFIQTVPEATVTGSDLQSYCRQHLAAYKTPTSWVFVDSLPLTASGKIRKIELRESLT
jgi:fatty-acyl-CoA synthase